MRVCTAKNFQDSPLCKVSIPDKQTSKGHNAESTWNSAKGTKPYKRRDYNPDYSITVIDKIDWLDQDVSTILKMELILEKCKLFGWLQETPTQHVPSLRFANTYREVSRSYPFDGLSGSV